MKRTDLQVGKVYGLRASYYNRGAVVVLDEWGYDRVNRNYKYEYDMNLKNGGRWIRVAKMGDQYPDAKTLSSTDISAIDPARVTYVQAKDIKSNWQWNLDARALEIKRQQEQRDKEAAELATFKKTEMSFINQLAWLGLDAEDFKVYQDRYGNKRDLVQLEISLMMRLLTSIITQQPVVPLPAQTDAESPNAPAQG